ncbi:MAG: hypothetical protein RH982_05270 [Parvibaculum sp.]
MASALRKVRRHIRFMLLFCGALFAASAYLQTASSVQTSTGSSMPGSTDLSDDRFRVISPEINVHDGDRIRIGEVGSSIATEGMHPR